MKPNSLKGDQRGAILVVGLLACVLLFGVVWTVMGIGESIAFRQRGQTAADAVAFSAAVMQARGMNFLVFLNLMMAAILVVRVCLRVLEVGLVLIAIPTLFASLELIPDVEDALTTANEFIRPALFGLGIASQAVLQIAPSFAEGSATYVAKNYTPVVKSASITSDVVTNVGAEQPGNRRAGTTAPTAPTSEGEIAPLPVQADTTGYALCAHAVDTMFGVLDDLVGQIPVIGGPVNAFLGLLQGVLSTVVGAGAPYFCQLGVNLNPPQLPPIDDRLKVETDQCEAKHPAPNPSNYTPGDPAYQSDVQSYQQAKQACINRYEGIYNTATGIAFGAATTWAQEGLGLDEPQSMGVAQGWSNGDSRLIAIATLDTSVIKGGLSLFGSPAASALPQAASYAFSESEFYYDCKGRFGGSQCDGVKTQLADLFGNQLSIGGGDAMWNFKWRARLVPVNTQADVVQLYSKMTGDYRNQLDQGGDGAAVSAYKAIEDYMVH